jgi:hypothetical protein
MTDQLFMDLLRETQILLHREREVTHLNHHYLQRCREQAIADIGWLFCCERRFYLVRFLVKYYDLTSVPQSLDGLCEAISHAPIDRRDSAPPPLPFSPLPAGHLQDYVMYCLVPAHFRYFLWEPSVASFLDAVRWCVGSADSAPLADVLARSFFLSTQFCLFLRDVLLDADIPNIPRFLAHLRARWHQASHACPATVADLLRCFPDPGRVLRDCFLLPFFARPCDYGCTDWFDPLPAAPKFDGPFSSDLTDLLDTILQTKNFDRPWFPKEFTGHALAYCYLDTLDGQALACWSSGSGQLPPPTFSDYRIIRYLGDHEDSWATGLERSVVDFTPFNQFIRPILKICDIFPVRRYSTIPWDSSTSVESLLLKVAPHLHSLIRSFCCTREPLPLREGAMRTRLERMLYTHRQELMHLAQVGRILEHQKRLFFRRRLLLQTGQTGSTWIENRWDFARAWAFRASPPRTLRSSDDTMGWLASQIAAGRGVRFAHFLAGRPALVITDAAVGSFVSVRRGELRNALAVAGQRFDANAACVALKQFLDRLRRAFADDAAPLTKLMRINGVLTAAFEHYQAGVRKPEPTCFPVFAALACFEANPQFLMSTLWYIREAFPEGTLARIARTDGLVHTFETLCRQRQLAGYREMFRTERKICLVDGELVEDFVRQATGIVGMIGTEWHVADAEWTLTTDRRRKVDAIVYGVKSQKKLANAMAFFKKVDPGNSMMKILLTNGPMVARGEWKVAPNVWRALGILTGHLQ